jgi:hypothetical protein
MGFVFFGAKDECELVCGHEVQVAVAVRERACRAPHIELVKERQQIPTRQGHDCDTGASLIEPQLKPSHGAPFSSA